MSNEIYLTNEGKKGLEERLDYLKSVARTEIAEKIKVAREFGDISENAEFDAAKEEQAMIEGEILEIETKLRLAKIINDKVDTSVVSVGNTVKILYLDDNEETEYKIVGTTEADVNLNKISNESPIGRVLLGRKKGETVEVIPPSGAKFKYKIKILKIS